MIHLKSGQRSESENELRKPRLANHRGRGRGGRFVSMASTAFGIYKELPVTDQATDSKRKSRDYLRSRLGRTPRPSNIGNSNTHLR